jgi:hypothetical protein
MTNNLPSPDTSPESIPEDSSEPSGLVRAVRAFGRGMLRLLIIILILAVLGAVAYLTVPLAYRELVLPVRDTAANLHAIETQNAVDQAALSEKLKILQTRLNQLETDGAAQDMKQSDLQSQVNSMRQDQSSLSESLARLDQLESEIRTLNQNETGDSRRIDQIQATLAAPPVEVLRLLREVQTLKVMNLLIRAQVNLAENNYGLAKTDLESARNVLLTLRDSLPENERAGLNPWIARLDLAINELPGSPVIAAGDLEIAYQLLAGLILPPTPTPGALTPTPVPSTNSDAAAATALPSATPTPARAIETSTLAAGTPSTTPLGATPTR